MGRIIKPGQGYDPTGRPGVPQAPLALPIPLPRQGQVYIDPQKAQLAVCWLPPPLLAPTQPPTIRWLPAAALRTLLGTHDAVVKRHEVGLIRPVLPKDFKDEPAYTKLPSCGSCEHKGEKCQKRKDQPCEVGGLCGWWEPDEQAKKEHEDEQRKRQEAQEREGDGGAGGEEVREDLREEEAAGQAGGEEHLRAGEEGEAP